jgi:hypothetical protein
MFQIRITNSSFDDCSESDLADAAVARAEGLRAALQIGAEEICRGSSFFAAEAQVERDGEILDRFIVSIGTAPLR